MPIELKDQINFILFNLHNLKLIKEKDLFIGEKIDTIKNKSDLSFLIIIIFQLTK